MLTNDLVAVKLVVSHAEGDEQGASLRGCPGSAGIPACVALREKAAGRDACAPEQPSREPTIL